MPASPDPRLRVAIVHYWFLGHAGGERVVEALAEMFPQADLFALFADRASMSPRLRRHRLATSFLDRLPGGRRFYQRLLPLHPLALEQLDLRGYDLVLSSESGPAKGVLTPQDACHICYCHSPMRYLWDLYQPYRRGLGRLSGGAFALAAHYLRQWDLASAARVDAFLANSHWVAARIRKWYGRQARVIYPPVDLAPVGLAPVELAEDRPGPEPEDYYLVVSRLVEYKRVDLAIAAADRLQRPLRIVGDGPEYRRLKKLAGPTVRFLGRLDDDAVRRQYARCRALLFPGEEDFGIVPVEAQSFGRPVIAYARGGALETVEGFFPGEALRPEQQPTGVFFRRPDAESLAEAMLAFEAAEGRFSPGYIRRSVRRFSRSRFQAEMTAAIAATLAEWRGQAPQAATAPPLTLTAVPGQGIEARPPRRTRGATV
jgi:glycosyltransferase involved in cell wall biosynthesis